MAAYEGMKVGVESGLDPKILEKVIREGLAQSWIANEWSDLSFGPHSQMVFHKDLDLGLKLAHDLGVSVPGAGLAQQMPIVLYLCATAARIHDNRVQSVAIILLHPGINIARRMPPGRFFPARHSTCKRH